MDRTLERLLGDPKLGIVYSEGLPLGVNVWSFTRAAMARVHEHYQSGPNDTGFMFFFTKTDLVAREAIGPMSRSHVLDEARLTLDYEVDLRLFRAIFEALYRPGEVFGLAEVVTFLKGAPDVMAINAGLNETYWSRTRDKARLEYRDKSGTVRRVNV